jgi:hypothetical protein
MLVWPDLETIKTYAEILTSALVPLSIYLAYLQMKKTLEWNKKKTAEEALTQVVTGDILRLYELLATDFHWSILTDKRQYNSIIKEMPTERIHQLDKILLAILRHLETLTIKIEHNVYDESICFDYLFSIVINTYKGCTPYIAKTRKEREENRIFEHVERYAKKWEKNLKRKKGALIFMHNMPPKRDARNASFDSSSVNPAPVPPAFARGLGALSFTLRL